MTQNRFKFRVWDSALSVYIKDIDFFLNTNGELLLPKQKDSNELKSAGCDRFIVEQCTGLSDCDGNLIYEGDIVEYEYHNYLDHFKTEIHTISYNNLEARWKFDNTYIYFNADVAEECRVIGNINENKNLTKNK